MNYKINKKEFKMKKTQTIKIGNGIDYAKVSTRLKDFLEVNTKCSLKTEYEFSGESVIFKATITPDIAEPTRIFTGTAMGKMSTAKAFEKLETVAVGRALAFSGYLSDGEIASDEEMELYFQEKQKRLDEEQIAESVAKLNGTSTVEELSTAWKSLTAKERADEKVLKTKNDLKAKYDNKK